MKILVTFRVQVPMGLDMALGYGQAIKCTEMKYEDSTLVLDGRSFPNIYKFDATIVADTTEK